MDRKIDDWRKEKRKGKEERKVQFILLACVITLLLVVVKLLLFLNSKSNFTKGAYA
jgi:Tfp pilus assembly protein PilN